MREYEAAVQIQAHVRGLLTRRAYVTLVDRHRMAFAQHWMAESERETRTLLQMERQQHEKLLANATLVLDQPLEASSSATQEVSLLVSTWRRLRRIFLLTHTATSSLEGESGCEYRAYEAVFAKLDARQDGVLDRAELRAGVRSFGVRIDRKLTRMYVRAALGACRYHTWHKRPKNDATAADSLVRAFSHPQVNRARASKVLGAAQAVAH